MPAIGLLDGVALPSRGRRFEYCGMEMVAPDTNRRPGIVGQPDQAGRTYHRRKRPSAHHTNVWSESAGRFSVS
jgi:hypothetical protein